MKIPEDVEYIIETLETHGHEAYAVGGCVRDIVMGKTPKDWDICTSALPGQTAAAFESKRIFETGLKHGTITLRLNGRNYEITTFRTDGPYLDNRRPDRVEFVRNLEQDLARRDFTVNALALHPQTGITDCFGGIEDIESKTIRCVGDPVKRFEEDALRIMRALRFASVLGFQIEPETATAIAGNRQLLKNISAERIAAELNLLLTGAYAGTVLTEYSTVLAVIIPEILPMIGFEQNTPYHNLDVWGHTVKSVTHAPEDIILRLTMLLHDIGKPNCYTYSGGKGHFHGHQAVSEEMSRKILLSLKYDNSTIGTVTTLVKHHDAEITLTHKSLRRWLNLIGEENLRRLIQVKKADIMAQADLIAPNVPRRHERLEKLAKASELIDEIFLQQQCFSLKDLAVDGRDLIAAGIPEGAEIGKTLSTLLDMVIDGELENKREILLNHVNHATAQK